MKGVRVKTAVIVLFHGSRAERAGEVVQRIVTEVRQRSQFDPVMEAFLQHAKPGLRDSIQQCIQQDVRIIIIVPFFLQLGMHVTADIPTIVAEAKKNYPGLQIIVTDAVGSHPLMIDIVLDLAGKRDDAFAGS